MEVLQLRVRDVRWEAEGVVSVGLTEPNGRELPPWTPGAHVDVRLTPTIERQYSLCSDPADRGEWRVAVLREAVSRGGSDFVHRTLRPGDMLQARTPVNNFELAADAAGYVFVAGGIGIAPILPMIRAVRHRKWRLAYLGKAIDAMAFGRDPLLGDDNTELFPADQGKRADLKSWIGTPENGTKVYCCGPPRLLHAAQELAAGWPAGTLRIERFQPKPRPAPDQDQQTAAFTVNCERSGRSLVIGPGRSILECLEEAGLVVPSSCREGVCGTCETRLIEGVAEHRDSILAPDERETGETMMICVSRAKTPALVLDL